MLLEVTTPEHTAETATEQTPLGDDFLSQYAVPPVGPNALGTFISLYAGAGAWILGSRWRVSNLCGSMSLMLTLRKLIARRWGF